MMNKVFWKAAFERAVKTAAQSVLLAIGAAQGADLFALDWQTVLLAAAGGAVLSVLTSIVSVPFGQTDSPSLLKVTGPSTASPATPIWSPSQKK